MAKNNRIPIAYLFFGGSLLLSLSWLMPSFPLLSFFALAPFMAIVANSQNEKSVWNNLELILLGLFISYFASTIFDYDRLLSSIVAAFVFTLAFLGYTFSRHALGHRTSLITLILYWLAIEYAAIYLMPDLTPFLADLLHLKLDWVRWNYSTGYLGASLWILVCNYLIYKALLTDQKFSPLYGAIFLIVLIAPITYSSTIQIEPITKSQMIALYEADTYESNQSYSSKGEYIPRTSAWVSVLILLFTLVRYKTNRKK